MAVASHPENFFQTTSSIAEIERKKRKASNTQGNPIKLPSKILAIELDREYDESGDTIFAAEAGGLVSSINISTGKVSRIGKAAQAPLTSLAHLNLPESTIADEHVPARHAMYAGGWDKTITKFTFSRPSGTSPPSLLSQTSFKAHGDFVKCLAAAITADGVAVLVSGGADGELAIWDAHDNRRLAKVNPQARSIECIALDPYSDPTEPTVYFCTSQREIFRLIIPRHQDMLGENVQLGLSMPLVVHETSVYKIYFDERTMDMWTASADKTAKRLSRDSAWAVDLTLEHPDFVRDVVTSPVQSYVVTACRDETVRVWNSNTGDFVHAFVGHYEEVTGLAFSRHMLISVSIDATLRRWSLTPDDLAREIERAKIPVLTDDESEPEPNMDLGLTEEEEAELRAMMEDAD